MRKAYKKKEEKLTSEGTELRQPVAELEAPATERKQAEQPFWETRQAKLAGDKYFNLIKHAADGIAIIQDGVFKLVNTALIRISGYVKEELLGMPFTQILTPQSQKLTMARYQARIAGKKAPKIYEIKAITKDGKIRDIEINAALTEYEGRVADEIIIRDITERKQVEDKIKKAEQEKTAILNSMSELVAYQDTQHQIIWTNKAAAESVGKTREQLLGRYCYEIWAQRDTPCAGCPVVKAHQTGKPQHAEITTPDGRVWLVQAYPTQDASGSVTGIVEVVLEITERKQAEEALQESEAFNSSLLANSPNPIIVINPDTSIQYVNPALEKLTGLSPAEVLGRKAPYPWWAKETLNKTSNDLEQAMHHGATRLEELFQKKNGERFWVELTSTPVKINGEFKCYLANWVDITERKKAEQALTDEATRRRILIDQSIDGIVVLDENAKVYEANQKFAEMLGYTPEEVRELHTWDWDTQWSRQELLEMGRKVDEAGLHLETHHRRKDGTNIDVEISINGAVCSGQKLIFCVCRDITGRKQMEDLIKRAEQEKTAILNSMSELVAYQDTEHRIIWTNKAAAESVGLTCEQLLGRHCYDIWPQRDTPCAGCPVTKARQTGKPKQAEITTPDGRIWLIHAYPTKDADGSVTGIVEVRLEITERKKSEQALRESQEFSSNLLESSPNPILVLNPDTSIKYVNPSFTKLTGFALDEIAGCKAPHPWWPEEYRKEMQAGLEKAMATGGNRRERTFQKKNGERFWVVHNSAPVIHEEKLIHFLENWVDITERKQAEGREQELERELHLSSRLAAIGELAAGIAHQINNPLTGVLGFSQRLLRKSTDQEVSQDLKRIYTEAERAAKVVQNLLTFARRRQPNKQYSDINEILESALELRAYELTTSNIEVVTNLVPKLPEVMLDFHQIQEVFLNIILNAEQAITEANDSGKLTIKTEERKGYLRVTFTDNGPGIPAENLEKVFDPFFSTKTKRGGTGLGLSVCHGIVTEHGGKIYARSKPGKGTTFFVELPLPAH